MTSLTFPTCFEHRSIHLQAHSVVDLIVGKGDVVLVDGVPIASFRVSQTLRRIGPQTRHFLS